MEAARGLNAYIVETPEKALAMAAESDRRIAAGEARALEGVPLGIKDLFCTDGVHSQAASRILEGYKPVYESTVTANLWADGAVMLGKLNMDEFAMGSSNETSAYGPVVNPWRSTASNAPLVPGGSSGGSATAVAAFLCAGATATDTGGSIRQPAAFTATVGVKPTYGRCSRWGIIAFASSLDQAGPIARDVRDAAILLQVDGERRPEGHHLGRRSGAGLRGGARAGREGAPDRHPEGVPGRRHAGRGRGAVGEGQGVAHGGGRDDGRHLAAAYEIRAAGLLHRGAGGGLVQPRAL